MIHGLIRKLRGTVYRSAVRLTTRGGVNPTKVVFNQTDGNGFGCNQKYIAREILRRHPDWDLVWLCRDAKTAASLPEGIRAVPFFSFAAMKELMTAGFWCSNQFFRHHVKHCGLLKRPGQFYFQTWHGSMGIKTVHSGKSWAEAHPESAGNEFKRLEGAMVDFAIANSRWDAEQQLDFYFGHGEPKLFGHPRNDLFFSPEAVRSAREKVFARYGFAPDTKTVLYVPTLRLDKRYDGYLYRYDELLAAAARRFGGEWKLLARIHPVLLHKGRGFTAANGVANASDYPDIQELMAAADILVSDYSSCMFDYMLQRRPCFAYVPDLDSYEKNEGLVYPLSETPFPVAKTPEELAAAVTGFDADRYPAAVDGFLAGKGCAEDGRAAERTVDLMEACLNRRNQKG